MNSALSFARNRFAQNSLKFIQLFVRLIAVLFFCLVQSYGENLKETRKRLKSF